MFQKASSQSDDTEGISYQREEMTRKKPQELRTCRGGSPARQRDDASSKDFYNPGIDNARDDHRCRPAGRAEASGRNINQTAHDLSSVLFQEPRRKWFMEECECFGTRLLGTPLLNPKNLTETEIHLSVQSVQLYPQVIWVTDAMAKDGCV